MVAGTRVDSALIAYLLIRSRGRRRRKKRRRGTAEVYTIQQEDLGGVAVEHEEA